MKKHIYLLPYGGLCNRINTMTSTINLVKASNLSLTVFWENNVDLTADFKDLFCELEINNIKIVKLRWYHFLFFRARKKNLLIPKLIRFIFGFKQIEDLSTQSNVRLENLGNSKYTYLSTCHAIGCKGNISEIFIPKESLTQKLNSLISDFSENIIGLHIRRGDHIKAIKASPMDNFYRLMDLEIDKNNETKFFIATDSKEVKEDLLLRYDDRIISQNVDLRRNKLEGMHGAVIDLWALSETKKIIGTNLSTFSVVASEIGGIELIK